MCHQKKKKSWESGEISLLNELPFCLIISQSICPKNPFLKLTSINILQKFPKNTRWKNTII